jgi:hypothetical protein
MSTPKAIQMILARQLASCVAMPILLVDTAGTLVFYNEPAEEMLNQRFRGNGEIPADDWNRMVMVTDENKVPLPPDERPIRAALLSGRPVSRSMWTRRGGGALASHADHRVPLVGEGDALVGVMSIFWEIK